jgi:phage-related protein
MPNQVTLTFAGETKQLEESFGKAGGAARKMGDDTEHASQGFHKAGEAADAVDTKAMGFRDTITGVQDSMTGLKNIASGKGSLADGLLTLGMGVGDLASGFYNFLIPALASSKAGTLAQAAAGKVAAGASKVWAAGQWLLNTALLASPITWIVVGIVALVAVIVLIATKTNWFQRAWGAAWGAIRSTASAAWGFIRQIPGWIGSAFSGIASSISGPFRSAFNFIASRGTTRWAACRSDPVWVPGIGGNGFGDAPPRLTSTRAAWSRARSGRTCWPWCRRVSVWGPWRPVEAGTAWWSTSLGARWPMPCWTTCAAPSGPVAAASRPSWAGGDPWPSRLLSSP